MKARQKLENVELKVDKLQNEHLLINSQSNFIFTISIIY